MINASYCQNCGFEIDGNRCPDSHCIMNNGESTPLPDTACYCPYCGSKSTHFEQEFISPINVRPQNAQ
jgi:rubredoxin